MTFTMFKISFDENSKQRGSFFRIKLPLPKFLSVERDGNIFLVNEAASQALEQEGMEFSKLSQMTFCCEDFYAKRTAYEISGIPFTNFIIPFHPVATKSNFRSPKHCLMPLESAKAHLLL